MHSLATIVGERLLMDPMRMNLASHTDHHKPTSGNLLVVSTVELVVIVIQSAIVLVILVTLIAVLLHLREIVLSI